MHIKGKMLDLIISFTKIEETYVAIKNVISDKIQFTKGVPQGGVLSPLLFNLVLADFPYKNVDGRIIANDIVSWAKGRTPEEAQKTIKSAVIQAVNWVKLNKMVFSNKTVAMIFNANERNDLQRLEIDVDSLHIPLVNHTRYLGVSIDLKLNFKLHINNILRETSNIINLMKCLAAKNLGADRSILNLFYTAAIRSKIEYAAPLMAEMLSSLNEPANILPHIPKYVNTKANWTMFRNKLNEDVLSLTLKSHTSVVTADTCAEAMTSILTNAANQAIPRTSPRKTIPKHTPKAWWTKDCQITWRIKNATRRAYLRKPSPATYLSKLQAEANLKRTITNAKYNYWNNFANNLSRETSEPRIHRLISKICGKKTSSNPLMYELIHENSHYDNDIDKTKLSASLFSKKLRSKNKNIITQIMTNPIYQPRPGSEYINHPFSIHELNNAIQHIKANATSSYDNIHPIWIKNLTP
ncbi:hypothetical protein QYM36_019178, partial [Artemia franciscana]